MPTVFETKIKSDNSKLRQKSSALAQFTPQHRYFHSFCIKPALRFETQSADEQVILILRAHPITQLIWIITAFIMIVLPAFSNIIFNNFLGPSQLFFINLFWYSFVFSYIFLNIINWLFNVGIITNKRIIDVDFHGILYKEVTAALLIKIEDITVKTGGFIPSIFNFGNLFIQTAGTETNIEFINIPFPAKAEKIINSLSSKHEY